jgi:hypothetical protein
MKTIQITKIQFPEIELSTRDAHKLRGHFGSLFREHSEVLNNHYETGEVKYRYPLVQFKILNTIPTLIALEEGAELLAKLFLRIREINIDGKIYEVNSKNIESKKVEIGYTDELLEYKFETLWMALNQKNYALYMEGDDDAKTKMLNKILVGNILSFFKNMNLRLAQNEQLMAKVKVTEKATKFKDKTMIAFSGRFFCNAVLPNEIGLGKSVSRGFGSIKIN